MSILTKNVSTATNLSITIKTAFMPTGKTLEYIIIEA